jgi:methionyl-tRNA formyltransferase
MGTAEFAVPPLRMLAGRSDVEVVLVVSQPDRPAGRGRQPQPPPVAVAARELGLDLFQPESLKSDEAFERLSALRPELIVVTAYGQILRQRVLDIPRHGCVNVHASLLPRWRGAAPISWAVTAGDAVTGVAVMRMERGLDTGPATQRPPASCTTGWRRWARSCSGACCQGSSMAVSSRSRSRRPGRATPAC